MKKYIAMFMALVLCLSVVGAKVFAATSDLSAESAETASVKKTVENYLRDCTYNMFMYESNDMRKSTVAELPSDLRESITIDTSIFDSADAKSDAYKSKVLSSDSIEFFNEKANYYKYVRSAQDIQRRDFNVKYTFENVKVSGRYAKIEAYEAINFYYTKCEEPTYIGTKYIVLLYKCNGVWYIYDITSDDPLDIYKNMGFDSETRIQGFNKAMNNPSSNVTVKVAAPEISQLARTYNIANVHYYEAAEAKHYAYTYCTSSSNNPTLYYNANFNYSGTLSNPLESDCQNFASQCVWAGLGGSNTRSAVLYDYIPADGVGTNKWVPIPSSASGWAWTSCGAFRDYIEAASSSSETEMLANIYSLSEGSDSLVSNNYYPYQLIGAVMHVRGYDQYGNAEANAHAIVVTNVNGTYPNRDDIMYCSHTTNHKNACLGDYYPADSNDDTAEIKIIIPECFYEISTCTNSSHTYSSSSDSTCNNCGYCRLWVRSALHDPVPRYSTVSLYSYANLNVSSISLQMTDTNGSTQTIGTANNTYSLSSNVYLDQIGLYVFTVTVTDSSLTFKNTYIYN